MGSVADSGSGTYSEKLQEMMKSQRTSVYQSRLSAGLFLFIRSGWANYMFFRAVFAFLDYEKAGALVFLENLLMLIFWAFVGNLVAMLCKKAVRANKGKSDTRAEEKN